MLKSLLYSYYSHQHNILTPIIITIIFIHIILMHILTINTFYTLLLSLSYIPLLSLTDHFPLSWPYFPLTSSLFRSYFQLIFALISRLICSYIRLTFPLLYPIVGAAMYSSTLLQGSTLSLNNASTNRVAHLYMYTRKKYTYICRYIEYNTGHIVKYAILL